MANVFEALGILFALVMIYFTYLEYKRSRLNKFSLYLWLFFWLGYIILIVLHPYVNAILPEIDIVRVLDLYMILAFMFLFAIVFYLFVIVKNVERRMEEVVRYVALKPVNNK